MPFTIAVFVTPMWPSVSTSSNNSTSRDALARAVLEAFAGENVGVICTAAGERSDFVSRYVFNKQQFYIDYESYSEAFRNHVVETLKSTYLKDKAALRLQLYGLKDE